MRVKFILPTLAEARGVSWRQIKYSLFPPLGLATLAAYLGDADEAHIVDEHVEPLALDDEPDLVAIETYVTSARRAYEIADVYRARGAYVVMGGLHATSLPYEALAHADTVVLGPAEEAWPRFLADFRAGSPRRVYRSAQRTLAGAPRPRRDLFKRSKYLALNSMVVSRGCPHNCDFCYKGAFFRGGRSFYTCEVDRALAEIESLPGRHLFFLDDNILADARFASVLFSGMRGMGRVWQGAATVRAILNTPLLDAAVASGMKSLFVGFESTSDSVLRRHGKRHNKVAQYRKAVSDLRDRGVMINASFVFGFDGDDERTFDDTVDWAVASGVETATFHILTPYPGTALFERYSGEGRLLHRDWDLYDTRHAVFAHPTMTGEAIEAGYRRAYKRFYSWPSILHSASTKPTAAGVLRHVAYTGAWKKFDPVWDIIVRLGLLDLARRPLEYVLSAARPEPMRTPAAAAACRPDSA